MDSPKSKNVLEDWQVSKQSICERSKYLLDNVLWTDCKFLVGTEEPYIKEFEAHKLILSMTSPVFATMFNGGWPDIQSPIKIVDVQPEAFKSMLEYIYTDTINMDSLDQACELCYVAKKYMLPHLLKNCMEFIWKDVDCNTALRAYEFAKLFDDPGILEKSMKIITEKTTDILSKAGALSMSMQTLLDILDQDQLNISSEVYLFNVLRSWVMFNVNRAEDEKDDADKVRTFARPALQKIRFLTMDVSDFADGPAQSPLLTKDESFAILLNISSPHSKFPLPDNFSTNRIPRTNPSRKVVYLSRKLYVPRPVRGATVQINNGCLTDKLYFTTSDNITLLGIQIPTQIAFTTARDLDTGYVCHQNADHSHIEHSALGLTSAAKSKYRELLIMFVKEVRNPENTWFTHFTSLVEHNSLMNVMFTTPAFIRRDQEYELGVTLNKEGYYLIGPFDRTVETFSDSVKFVLRGNTSYAFISSLIFTH